MLHINPPITTPASAPTAEPKPTNRITVSRTLRISRSNWRFVSSFSASCSRRHSLRSCSNRSHLRWLRSSKSSNHFVRRTLRSSSPFLTSSIETLLVSWECCRLPRSDSLPEIVRTSDWTLARLLATFSMPELTRAARRFCWPSNRSMRTACCAASSSPSCLSVTRRFLFGGVVGFTAFRAPRSGGPKGSSFARAPRRRRMRWRSTPGCRA